MILTEMSQGLILQYVATFTIVLAALLWIVIRIFGKKKKRSGGCSGCALAEHCSSKEKRKEQNSGCKPQT